ncbi:MAG: chorismate synthase [Parachlamydia sp.]|nr:MAG: chorismate synthase [Parachlamydia sp.]
MASNSFGNILRMTTWGESHGKMIGVVIDGCPAGLPLDETEINLVLTRRAPGMSPYTSPRKERDCAEVVSGVFEGKTTGAPISILIQNKDTDSSKYEPIKGVLRPGHANFTYLEKYGIFDYRGGGRASARETACRVAAGVVAQKLLAVWQIETVAYIKQIGSVEISQRAEPFPTLKSRLNASPVFCPDSEGSRKMTQLLEEAMAQGDSLGGVVEFHVQGLPVGLGDPIYEKLEANLAKALLSIPASKGFEIGEGFESAAMKGSMHNDIFISAEGKIQTETNYAGGMLGGISTGMPLIGRVAFKPTSSIKKVQATVSLEGQTSSFELPEGSRHDPCVAIRAVVVVEAMVNFALADALLMNRCVKL